MGLGKYGQLHCSLTNRDMEKFFKAASQEAVLLYNKETKIGVKIPFGTVSCAWQR